MNSKHHRFIGIPLLFLGLVASHMVLAQTVEVTGADPGAAPPATYGLDVIISGKGFDKTAKVHFLKSVSGTPADIKVNRSKVNGSTQITVNIDVSDTAADQDQYDIEVRMSRGRGGKGTTLFKVDSSASVVPNNDGNSIPMTCILNYPPDNASATVKHDGEPIYVAGMEKVGCQSGGVVNPNLAGLRMSSFGPGNIRKAKRFVDLAFGICTDDSKCLPEEFLDPSQDTVQMDARPNGAIDGHNHIHLMTTGEYNMPFSIWVDGFTDRYKIEMDAGNIAGVKPLQSHACHNDADGYQVGDDINVYIWEDGTFSGVFDDLPDGYTVTTGEISVLEAPGEHPVVTHAPRRATVCANVNQDGDACPSDKSKSALCYMRGQVDVEFTLHMQYD
jgi:hypothetical protein